MLTPGNTSRTRVLLPIVIIIIRVAREIVIFEIMCRYLETVMQYIYIVSVRTSRRNFPTLAAHASVEFSLAVRQTGRCQTETFLYLAPCHFRPTSKTLNGNSSRESLVQNMIAIIPGDS